MQLLFYIFAGTDKDDDRSGDEDCIEEKKVKHFDAAEPTDHRIGTT